jgi:RNA polymerase sigma-70 factor (ECF subfamily)
MDGQEHQSLIERARDGDSASQEALVRLYEGRIYGLILRMVGNTEDAKDILQETMVKALTSLHSYNPAYPFATWLFRIAANKSVDFLRRRRVELRTFTHSGELGVEDIPNGKATLDETVAQKLDWDMVERCMQKLGPQQRTVLFLRYKDGLSYAEIAEVLSMPMGTVKTMLHRGRRELKTLVRQEAGFSHEDKDLKKKEVGEL